MALLTFPFPVSDGTIYPVSPPAGTNIYQWVSAEQTWRLLGAASGVTAGTYGTPLSVPQITIDATGRITVAVDVPIQLGTTAQIGLVQLVDDLISNDPTKALTAAQGFVLSNEIGDPTLLNPFYPNLVTAINALGAPSGVTSGTYGNGSNVGQFTVNAQGRITSAVNVPLALATTTAPGVVRVGANLTVTGTGLLSVPNANTAQRGAVQLVDNTTTNDSTKALTAAAGNNLQLQIDALEARNNLTFAGTIDGATGLMLTVTAQGAAVGFTVGAVLPSPAPLNDEYFVVVTVPGTFTPTGGASQACNDGDWFVSDGSAWLYYNVGPTVAAATFIQLDDISGQFNGSRIAFTLRVSGVAYTPVSASAILLSVGGVIQIPGTSFTLSGSTVTFSEAPKANTTFVGYAVSGMTGGGGGGGGGTGTVTSVGTGTGLLGGPITTTGTISLRPATNSTLGGVQPDGTTITVSPTGVISVVGSGAGNLQTVTDNGSVTTRSITVGGLASTGTTTLGDTSSDLIYFLGRIATSFLPNVTEAYDLGSPTQRWRDLYVSSNSIYMGANQLTVSGGQLLINGTPVGGGGSVGTLQQVTTLGATTTNTIDVRGLTVTDNTSTQVASISSAGVGTFRNGVVAGNPITGNGGLIVAGSLTVQDANNQRFTVNSNTGVVSLGNNGIGAGSTAALNFYTAAVTGTTISLTASNGRVTSNQLVVAGLTYPTTDGTSGQVLTTNGAGTLSWASGSGAVSTLQQVTTAGNTTTDAIRLFDSGTSNEAIKLDPQAGLISIFPQAIGEPGLYLSSTGAQFGNSTGTFSSAGSFPCALKLNGSAGASLQTAQDGFPVQLWAGGTNLIGSPQVSVTGTATSISNQLQFSNTTQTATWAFIQATPTSLNLGIAPNTTVLNLTTPTTTISNNLQMAGYIQVNSPNGIRFYESSAVDYVGLSAPSSLGASYNLTLPPADGTADQVLATDGTGDLQWLTTAKIVAVPASSASGGAAGQIAFGNGFFYWFNSATSQWLRVAGSTF